MMKTFGKLKVVDAQGTREYYGIIELVQGPYQGIIPELLHNRVLQQIRQPADKNDTLVVFGCSK